MGSHQMLDAHILAVFAVTTVGLLLIPGPGMLFILARGIEHGRSAAFVSVLGFQAGDALHILAATIGLSAVLVASPVAFFSVKVAGAAYLAFLGITTILRKPEVQGIDSTLRTSMQRIFVQGAVVNALNPKTALFFLAFLPQFVDPDRGEVAGQILVLGGTFMFLAVICEGAFAMFSGSLANWLRSSEKFINWQRFVVGSIYIGLAGIALLSGIAIT